MGTTDYIRQPFVKKSAIQASSLEDCIDHIRTQSEGELSKIIIVDGDNLRHLWEASIKTAAGYIRDQVYRHGDFIQECRDRACAQYVQKVQSILSEFLQHFEAVYVIWGNQELGPKAKAATQLWREEERARERHAFIEKFSNYLSGATFNERRENFSHLMESHCGLPPVPSNIVDEARIGFFARLPKQGIVHVKSRDESDMSIARAEIEVPNAIVYSSDSDFIATLNCFIIRVLKSERYEVLKGRRSAKELSMAALVGNEYTRGKGCPGIGWNNAEDEVDAAIKAMATTGDTKPSAVAICKHVVDREEISEEMKESIVASVRVWEQRSHGHAVQPRTPPVVSNSDTVRKEAWAFAHSKPTFKRANENCEAREASSTSAERPRRSYAKQAALLVLENM